jgi:ATPase involved in DNA repair
MHQRSFSGSSSIAQNNDTTISCSSSHVRSLIDSPGDSHSDDESDVGCSRMECELDSDANCGGAPREESSLAQQGLQQDYRNIHTRTTNDFNASGGQYYGEVNQTPTPVASSTPWSSAATAASASVSSSDPHYLLLLGQQHSFDSPLASLSSSSRICNHNIDNTHNLLGYGAKSTAPLVLGSSAPGVSKQQSMMSSSNHQKYATTQKNEMLKSLLSTVQFPRPRMPFSPLVATVRETSRLATQEETKGGGLTAATFAQSAPKAGYLSKLGSSVSEYKKRFFVLKPTTCLYYFLSPSDEEPRGCIDLDGFVDSSVQTDMDGLKVNSLGTLPDGRFRFECVLPPTRGPDGEKKQSKKILLEARNEDIGKEWMQALTVERLSYSKSQCQLLQDQLGDLEKETKLLEERLKELHLVENDLEGALQDAQMWKKRAEDLNQAMYLLKRYLIYTDCNGDDRDKNSLNDKVTVEHDASNDASYFFTMSEEEVDLDSVKLPGTHFSSLLNACRGIRENLRLTSLETSSTLEDLKACNEKLKEREEKLEKAEKYVCKLWEENCAARESLRRRKSEKKILVNEIRSLQMKSSTDDEKIAKLEELNRNLVQQLDSCTKLDAEKMDLKSSSSEKVQTRHLATPELKLLSDLEDHINTTLVEHEYLLFDDHEDSPGSFPCPTSVGTGSVTQTDEMSNTTHDSIEHTNVMNPGEGNIERFNENQNEKNIDTKHSNSVADRDVKCLLSPLLPKQLSLMDQLALHETHSLTSATLEEFDKQNDNDTQASDVTNLMIGRSDSSKNALKSVVTDSGTATSKIICPMTDVLQSSPTSKLGGGKVYSLTFYSARIGLQFQRVPSTCKQIGLLNDAMRADIRENEGESATVTSRTEAELRVIASLSDTKPEDVKNSIVKDQSCPVIFPKDNVLVCGFQGFDESSGNRRPSLGATLVGFDGISIERGPWTFEAVRKAIKARGRPLMLTFRDDFLTHEQRAILTKAIGDVERSSNPSSSSSLPLPQDRQYPVPSTIKTHTQKSQDNMSKAMSCSAFPQDLQSFDDSTALTDTSRLSDTCRSFSDAGSSSIFSSKFSPLVTSLLPGMSHSRERKDEEKGILTPEYFRRSIDSLECASHHKEFKANLL